MKTTVGKLRSITTGILHTEIGDVYKFFEEYTGQKGIMTHHLPSAFKAIKPVLQSKLPPEWFAEVWQKEGLNVDVDVPDMTEDENKEFFVKFNEYNSEMWNVYQR